MNNDYVTEIKKAINEVLPFDIDNMSFKKQETINNNSNKFKRIEKDKNKIIDRVIKKYKKIYGRKLTSDEINYIKNI